MAARHRLKDLFPMGTMAVEAYGRSCWFLCLAGPFFYFGFVLGLFFVISLFCVGPLFSCVCLVYSSPLAKKKSLGLLIVGPQAIPVSD